jgi:DNA-binding CsgD family transcriptional regulator
MVLGREAQRAAIDELLEGARRRTSGVLVLSGEAGSGKTTLLAYARSTAGGLRVLTAEGIQAESNLAFSGLADLVYPVLSKLGRIPEVQAASLGAALALGPPAPGDRFTTYMAALNLIAAAAEEQPLLIVVDDAQWLDPASAEALFFAARRLGAEGVAMLIAIRSESELPADPTGLDIHDLAPLSSRDSLALLERHPRPIAREVAEAICSASIGNPLALVEVPSLLSEAQLNGYEPLPNPLPVGPRLMRAFQPRLANLPLPTRSVLLLAAASGATSMATLSRAAATMGIAANRAIAAAEEGGLIEVSGSLRFRHPLIRSAVYESASPALRRQAHAAIASALPDTDAGERVMHRAAAALGPDEAVALELEQLGQQEHARRGYLSASEISARAAALSPGVDDQVRRLTNAAFSSQLGGRSTQAVEYLDRALTLAADPIAHADLVLLRYRISMWLENPMAAHAALTAEATRIAARDPARAAVLLGHASAPCFMAADIRRALQTTAAALELAERSGDRSVIVGAEIALRGAQLLHGEGAVALPLMLAAVRTVMGGRPDPRMPIDLPYAACLLVSADGYAVARRILDGAIEEYRAAGALVQLAYPLAVLSELEFRTGAWLEAYADASESVQLARETGQANGRTYSLICLARVEAASGRDLEAQEHLDEAMRLAEGFGTGSIPTYVWAIEGSLELGRQRWKAAITPLERLRRRCQSIEMREPGVLRWQADLIEAYLRVGDRAQAAAVLEELETDVERTGRIWGRLTAARSRGMLAEIDEAAGWFSTALGLAGELDDPFEQARTHLAFGERLRRARRGSEAREHLHAALDTFDRLGANPWAARAQGELAATGERIPRTAGPVSRALTPAELQVCRAVATGQTNREVAAHLFLSLKTVESHLTSAYHKLGLRSRTELARLFAVDPQRVAMATSSPIVS